MSVGMPTFACGGETTLGEKSVEMSVRSSVPLSYLLWVSN
jgi:hypothetical protein